MKFTSCRQGAGIDSFPIQQTVRSIHLGTSRESEMGQARVGFRPERGFWNRRPSYCSPTECVVALLSEAWPVPPHSRNGYCHAGGPGKIAGFERPDSLAIDFNRNRNCPTRTRVD